MIKQLISDDQSDLVQQRRGNQMNYPIVCTPTLFSLLQTFHFSCLNSYADSDHDHQFAYSNKQSTLDVIAYLTYFILLLIDSHENEFLTNYLYRYHLSVFRSERQKLPSTFSVIDRGLSLIKFSSHLWINLTLISSRSNHDCFRQVSSLPCHFFQLQLNLSFRSARSQIW